MDELINRLSRYGHHCIAHELDPDFADAVQEAIAKLKDLKDCRNELCYKCGEYKTAHLGSCDGCRWKDGE